MLHPVLEEAVDTLLTVWRHYDDVTRRRAEHRVRAAARHKLDIERSRVNRLRRGLHPETRELEEVAFSVRCPSLDAPVFIRESDRAGDDYACPCGEFIVRPLAEFPNAEMT